MTDAHCHLSAGDSTIREILIGRDAFGTHPWEADFFSLATLTRQLSEHPQACVGEIGLDRLHARDISPAMRSAFEEQLLLALRFNRSVVLHGAKCWGQVVKALQRLANEKGHRWPSCLFHGFSRSDGLLPDMIALNGFVSVGPAVLNDHAVNYRALVKKIPDDRLLLETDRTVESAATCPPLFEIAAKTAALRNTPTEVLIARTDANAEQFLRGSPT